MTDHILGKVAPPRSVDRIASAVAERRRSGGTGTLQAETLTSGDGWRVLDVVCTCDATDRSGEEQHSHYSLALVLGGAFHYRGRAGAAHLAPGSILIGRAGAPFRCWHDFGAGDRCVAVQFEPNAFDELTSTLDLDLRSLPVAIPVDRGTTGLFAAAELLAGSAKIPGDRGFTIAVGMAGRVLTLAGVTRSHSIARRTVVSRALELARWIETDPAAEHRLPRLAAMAGMSRFHLVRVFNDVLGLPPYAFITRARLRDAAMRIVATDDLIVRVALEAGFGDLSYFNARFKQHFGRSPRALRQLARTRGNCETLVACERDGSGVIRST